jgi:hypothetical protein
LRDKLAARGVKFVSADDELDTGARGQQAEVTP